MHDMTDEPILTPHRTLALRAVDTSTVRFDLAVLCFRGPLKSRLVIEALGANRVDGPLFYGTQCYQAMREELSVAVLPEVIYGGPVTAILLEELACLGVSVAIGLGAAGSLVTGTHIGQMFIAERAAVQDGTSRAYIGRFAQEQTDGSGSDVWAGPDPQLLALSRRVAAQESTDLLLGAVWTTDALYQERPSQVARWREAGADLVNLECGPFYAVARAVGIRAIYLGLVTDFVSAEQGWRDGYWGRRNATDPVISRIARIITDTIARKEALRV
jgi:uridine phosphorylase